MRREDQDSSNRSTYVAAAILTAIVVYVLLNYEATQKLVCTRWVNNPSFKDEGCLLNYISEFQTLITGILAVSAAYFTFKQMRETDRLAERRHNEQMDIYKIPIKLKVERTIIPALRYFHIAQDGLDGPYRRLCSDEAPIKDRLLDYQREAIIVLRTAEMLVNELDAGVWKEVVDLFDGSTHRQFEQAQLAMSVLAQTANTISRCQISETIRRGDAMADKELEIDQYPIILWSAQAALNEFSDKLKALAKLYGVDTGI